MRSRFLFFGEDPSEIEFLFLESLQLRPLAPSCRLTVVAWLRGCVLPSDSLHFAPSSMVVSPRLHTLELICTPSSRFTVDSFVGSFVFVGFGGLAIACNSLIGDLSSQPGIEPGAIAGKAPGPNHWATRELL